MSFNGERSDTIASIFRTDFLELGLQAGANQYQPLLAIRRKTTAARFIFPAVAISEFNEISLFSAVQLGVLAQVVITITEQFHAGIGSYPGVQGSRQEYHYYKKYEFSQACLRL